MDGRFRGTFIEDDRIADPRGLAIDPNENLLFLNSGADRVLAISSLGRIVRDTGRIEGLNPGGGNFGPDGRYFVGSRSERTIIALPTSLDGGVEYVLPPRVIPFPRGFTFGHDSRLFLASGIGPDGQGDNAVVAFSRGEHIALFTASPLDVPGDWHVARSRWIDQMICGASLEPPNASPVALGTTEVPEMLALTAATDPGPFLPQTILMGSYFGIRASDGRLVAMAGERLQSTAFAEISAVCTHSEFRGRGYARALVTFLPAQILAAGKTPFLHVKSENGAKVVYHKIGFRLRAAMYLTVISVC